MRGFYRLQHRLVRAGVCVCRIIFLTGASDGGEGGRDLHLQSIEVHAVKEGVAQVRFHEVPVPDRSPQLVLRVDVGLELVGLLHLGHLHPEHGHVLAAHVLLVLHIREGVLQPRDELDHRRHVAVRR